MSKFFDRKEQVIEIELTKYGKRSFSMGKFAPKFYSFHDDDILYDSEFGTSGSIKNSNPKNDEEKQNDIVDRIKTTPRVSVISDSGWEKNHKFFTATGEDHAENTNAGAVTPNQISPATAKFLRPIGTSSPLKNFAPAWEIKTMPGSEPLSVSGTEDFPLRNGASGSEVIVPYFSSSLPLEYEVDTITVNVDANNVVIQDGGREVTEDIFEITKEGRLLLDIQELNTVFKSNGNFDIEVFKTPIRQGQRLEAQRLHFINDSFLDANGLRIQEDPDEYARALAGDDEIIGENVPLLDPTYVEYFLSVRVDEAIEEVQVRGDTLYQGGPTDPVDPCEDV
tara:strand:+ start:14297 stop:15307 length:1011 start_codon:yes stop_codon:yes gene_type:complete